MDPSERALGRTLLCLAGSGRPLSTLPRHVVGRLVVCALHARRGGKRAREGAAEDEPPRKIARPLVATHYDARAVAPPRRAPAAERLHDFNNWIKNVLLARVLPRPNTRVLDVAAGKGGDLIKMSNLKVRHLYCVDISGASLDEAARRYNALRLHSMRLWLLAADAGALRFVDTPDWPRAQFHAVSCQFALHYFFDTVERAQMLLCNVADALMPGGVFAATVPCARGLLERLGAGGLEHGNALYHVRFSQHVPLVLSADGTPRRPPGVPEFGCRYRFKLTDAVDLDESIIWPETLERMAAESGLYLHGWCSFDDFARQNAPLPQFAALPQFRRWCRNGRSLLTPAEAAVASLYRVAIFVRSGAPRPPPDVECPPQPPLTPNADGHFYTVL